MLPLFLAATITGHPFAIDRRHRNTHSDQRLPMKDPQQLHPTSNRRKLVILASSAVVILLLALPFLSRWRQPRADGKPLAHWLAELKIGLKVQTNPDGTYTVMLRNLSEEELSSLKLSRKVHMVPSNQIEYELMFYPFPNWPDQLDYSPQETLSSDPAARAIRNIGARAVPYLRAGLHSHESKISAAFYRWVWPHIPGRLRAELPKPLHPVHVRANSAYALGLLGAAASPAVPELQEMLKNDPSSIVRSVVRESLQRISPATSGPFYPELFEQTKRRAREPQLDNTNSPGIFPSKLTL